MATVGIILPAFGIKWAQDGTVEAIDEAQWRAGWSFIGATPPSVEQFNKVHQVQDEKANWLYQQLLAVFTAAGETPTAGDLTSLRDSIATLYGGGRLVGTQVFSSNGTYTPTAGTKSIVVEAVGGGGAGSGFGATGSGTTAVGGGGGGGAYGCGRYLSGFSGATVTVGAGTVGGLTTGTAGGTTSFGALLSVPGGAGGSFGTFATPTVYVANGGAGGAFVSISGANVKSSAGAIGAVGLYFGAAFSGVGGNSPFGGGGASPTANANGANATSPGAGGGGAASIGPQAARTGGNGSAGIVIVWEFA